MKTLTCNELTLEQIKDIKALAEYCRSHGGDCPNLYWSILDKPRQNNSLFLSYIDSQLVALVSFYWFEKTEMSLLIHPSLNRKDAFRQLYSVIALYHDWQHLLPLILSTNYQSASPLNDAVHSLSELHLSRPNSIKEKLSNTGLILQPATKKNMPELVKIDQQCFAESHGFELRVAKLLDDDEYRILLALVENEIIGKIHLHFHDNQMTIYDFAVLPCYQGQGFGQAILKKAINISIDKGSTEVNLDVEINNQKALMLYEKCGFIIKYGHDYWQINSLAGWV